MTSPAPVPIMPGAATVPLRGVSGRTLSPLSVDHPEAFPPGMSSSLLAHPDLEARGQDVGKHDRALVAHALGHLVQGTLGEGDGNPSRDRRLAAPTRPPGEQTSVSVRNATG